MLILKKEVVDFWNGNRYPREKEIHLARCAAVPESIQEKSRGM